MQIKSPVDHNSSAGLPILQSVAYYSLKDTNPAMYKWKEPPKIKLSCSFFIGTKRIFRKIKTNKEEHGDRKDIRILVVSPRISCCFKWKSMPINSGPASAFQLLFFSSPHKGLPQ